MSLVVGTLFIVFGFILMKYPPSRNNVMGYKSLLAMKNQDTWNVAQKHSGFILMIFGAINGIFGIWSIIQPMTINKEKIQLLLLILSAVAILAVEEIHLIKLFNMDGSRKKSNNL
ncbi:SdpI family protein [Clostridium estertheticum]|uniref:SdpI family protein n=1 Tax=Clostridium estertheticum TaxID=238834 RepID=UPI001C7DAFF2|nr:SdpI family protein [Clostridium estertheticum]MBX4265423.1 SdpI family protein [Clostridium estertheticum]WLC90225.1 SdpI family protein [Clostridium estertheticum]